MTPRRDLEHWLELTIMTSCIVLSMTAIYLMLSNPAFFN